MTTIPILHTQYHARVQIQVGGSLWNRPHRQTGVSKGAARVAQGRNDDRGNLHLCRRGSGTSEPFHSSGDQLIDET